MFFRTIFLAQKSPQPQVLTQPSKISPEAGFENFSKSLQKERAAIFREILSRIHPSKLQTEPRGEKHIFMVLFFKQKSEVLRPKPNIYDLFFVLGPFWDVWCPKPNIYELFF